MKNLIIILIFGIGFNSVNAQSTELKDYFFQKADLVSFNGHGFNYHRELILASNEEFIKTEINVTDYGGGKSTVKKYYGNYKLTDSILTLNPKKVELETYTGYPERKRLKKTIDYKSDSEIMFVTVFVIKQNNNLQYLIPLKYRLRDIKFEKISKRTRKRLLKRKFIK
ncbi:hypothetical protein [Aquimarina megaterium]|uniref:hypothetical protein n=1 Tax=Aquimarina megaterium TaxID=1443666 RepID=UPI000944FE76|nr:hypothetical protein [Aquimarina megaterium]